MQTEWSMLTGYFWRAQSHAVQAGYLSAIPRKHMNSLLLVLIVVTLFAMLFAYEAASDGIRLRPKASGLLTWLVSGNWPAKVGAGLVIVGVGALLRYAFANINIPAELKLGSGVIVAAMLGLVAMRLKNQPTRRAIHLALAGAAFGVAYLTAYSAYGFFNYLNDVNALTLLALVSIAAGTFAVSSNAMSVAILAMVGAYIAPKFAIGAPGALQVYGYYLAVSVLSLVMVTMRGWRPLIHLSFLFALAGALFFGWSGRFYEPDHYQIMLPLLLALTMVHLAMPLLERKYIRSQRLVRFDSAYFILLPLVAAALALKISPRLHIDGAVGLGLLALVWGGAAVILKLSKRDEVSRHVLVAIALTFGSIFCYQEDLPWLQLALGGAVAAMAMAPRLNWSRGSQELLCGAATLFGVMNIIHSILQLIPAEAFLNELFAHRMISSALMVIGAWIGGRQSIKFAQILGLVGGGWAVLSILAELLQLNIDFLPQLIYCIVLGCVALSIVLSNRKSLPAIIGGVLLLVLIACGWWAMHGASNELNIVYLTMTFAVLLGMAYSGRDSARADGSDFSPSMAIGLLPFALLPWAISIAEFAALKTDFFEASIAMLGIAAAGLSARFWLSASPRWNERIQPLHVYLTAFALLWVTLFHIERGVWPVVFELLALTYLVAYVLRRSRERRGVGFGVGAMMVLSVALFLQAMLLRGFGPDIHVMDASDINKMHLPAVVSLMWVTIGAGLAWWGTQIKLRSTWSVGAFLLVVAAVKLVFFDFGALGQLGNILAFIAAGLIFLGVAWFAPMPSKLEIEPEVSPVPSAGEQDVVQPIEISENKPQAETQANPAPTSPRQEPCRTADGSPQPRKPVDEIDVAGATFAYRDPSDATIAYRYRAEPRGVNGLWFLVLGLAIVVAVCFSAWHKYSRQQKLRHERQRIAEANWKAQLQFEVNNPKTVEGLTVPEPSTPAGATDTVLPDAFRPPSPSSTKSFSSGAARVIKVVDACTNFVERLPSDYVVYAAGAYQGRKQDNLFTNGRATGRFDVYANFPGEKVVLALGAYEPSVWNVRWAPATTVVGVLVSGYHTQTVLGVPRDVPVLNVSYESKSPCGFFYMTREAVGQVDVSLQKILGRPARRYVLAMDGRIDLGPEMSAVLPSVQSNSKIERHVDKNGRIEYRQVPDGG